jgi:hypothetical protein
MYKGALNVFIVGLDRCPLRAANSIVEKLIAVVPSAVDLRVYAYLWVPEDGKIINSRSGENCIVRREDSAAWSVVAKDVNVCVEQKTPAELFSNFKYVREMVARGDIFDDGYCSLANYVGYLSYSNEASLFLAANVDLEIPALLLRPDLVADYLDMDRFISFLDMLEANAVYTPYWGSFSYCNDRVIIGQTKNVLKLMQRIQYIPHWLNSCKMFFFPESFMCYSISHLGLVRRDIPFEFRLARIRSNGDVVLENYAKDSLKKLVKYRLWCIYKTSIFRFAKFRETLIYSLQRFQ